MDAIEAKKIIDDDVMQRVTDCQTAVNEALVRFNCALDAAMTLRSGTAPSVVITIVSK